MSSPLGVATRVDDIEERGTGSTVLVTTIPLPPMLARRVDIAKIRSIFAAFSQLNIDVVLCYPRHSASSRPWRTTAIDERLEAGAKVLRRIDRVEDRYHIGVDRVDACPARVADGADIVHVTFSGRSTLPTRSRPLAFPERAVCWLCPG